MAIWRQCEMTHLLLEGTWTSAPFAAFLMSSVTILPTWGATGASLTDLDEFISRTRAEQFVVDVGRWFHIHPEGQGGLGRPILRDNSALLLGAQLPVPGQAWMGWDAIEYLSRDANQAVVLAFKQPRRLGNGHDSAQRAVVRRRWIR